MPLALPPPFAPLVLAQVGPFVTAAAPALPVPPPRSRRPADGSPTAKPAVAAGACTGGDDAEAVRAAAQARFDKAAPAARMAAGECLGGALVALGRFEDARGAFLAARDAAPAGDHGSRARLGAMAGNAALAGDDAPAALTALDVARSDAGAAGDRPLTAGIAVDRARALVALKRDGEAGEALADARAADPGDADAWLLSATLSRRVGQLDAAQAQIQEAARLRPADPDTGLEAGVIAMLAGREDAARRSWQSVRAIAPDSDAAATAGGYLAQLGPAAGPSPAPAQAEADTQAEAGR